MAGMKERGWQWPVGGSWSHSDGRPFALASSRGRIWRVPSASATRAPERFGIGPEGEKTEPEPVPPVRPARCSGPIRSLACCLGGSTFPRYQA